MLRRRLRILITGKIKLSKLFQEIVSGIIFFKMKGIS
jgi:hypothetical protein